MKDKPNKKGKQFLKVPEYPGGKQALQIFVNAHLQYPADAFREGMEGVVSVAYEVNDLGEVESAKVIKGLMPSCNEEALRIVHLLKYGKAYNHGIRVKSNHKVNIYFKLPRPQSLPMQFSYMSSENEKQIPEPLGKEEEYTYSIHLPVKE